MINSVKVIDGRLIDSESAFHTALAATLDFGPYYGHNLNALWDRLLRDVERPAVLVWKYSEASRSAMGGTFEEIVDLMRRIEQEDVALGRQETFQLRLC